MCRLLGLAPPTTYLDPRGPSFSIDRGMRSKHRTESVLVGGLGLVHTLRASSSMGASRWLVVIGKGGGGGVKDVLSTLGCSGASLPSLCVPLGSVVGLHRSMGWVGAGRSTNTQCVEKREPRFR